MPGVAQVIDLRDLPEWIEKEGQRLESLDFSPVMPDIALSMAAHAKRCIDEGRTPDGQQYQPLKLPRLQGGDKPLYASGILEASLSPGGEGNIIRTSALMAEAGTNVDYAAIHQFGGDIKPTGGKMLAIPLTTEARRHNPRKTSATSQPFPRLLFALKSKAGNPILAEKEQTAKGKWRIIPTYLLVPSVRIPARPFLGFGERLMTTIGRIFKAFLDDHFGGGGAARRAA